MNRFVSRGAINVGAMVFTAGLCLANRFQLDISQWQSFDITKLARPLETIRAGGEPRPDCHLSVDSTGISPAAGA